MKTAHIERLLKLLQALQSGRPNTADQLAELLGVSRRTVYRDLRLLARGGIVYKLDRKTGRYTTTRTSLLPPVTLTHSEALSLMLATRYLLHQYTPDQTAALAAGMKIEGVLPAAMRDDCGPLLERIEIRPPPASDTTSIVGAVGTLQSALARKRKVQIRYDSYYEGGAIDTVLHPYRLAHIHRGWYLIAHSEQHAERRTFKVERILQIKMLDAPFTMDATFSLEEYFGNAWNMIRGEKPHHVKIRFLKMVAANVDEIVWHKTQRTCFQEDGSLLFEADVDGAKEISWWILGYGDQAQVLEPPELRDIVGRHARHMNAFYRQH
jgi:proteasome accessory factor B